MVKNGEKQGRQPDTFSAVIKACVPVLILLVLWQLAFMSGKWSAYVLPGPEKVWKSFISMAGNGTLAKHIFVSFKRVFTGFSISFICAFCLGMLAALKKDLEVYYGPYVEFMRNVPPYQPYCPEAGIR